MLKRSQPSDQIAVNTHLRGKTVPCEHKSIPRTLSFVSRLHWECLRVSRADLLRTHGHSPKSQPLSSKDLTNIWGPIMDDCHNADFSRGCCLKKPFLLLLASVLLDRVNGGVFNATPLKLRSCPLLLILSFRMSVLVAQSCPTLCDRVDCSPARLLCPRGWSRQECWSGLPFPSPGHLPDSGIEPASLASLELAGRKGGLSRWNYVRVKALWWWLNDGASYHGFSWPSYGHSGRTLRDLIILWNSIKTLPRYWI